MKELAKLLDRIIQRININLRELDFDITPFVKNLVPLNQMVKFYAFYGITPNHPLDLVFRHSSLAGSYFLGKIRTRNSILYKTDIRGDELKQQGDVFHYQNFDIPITRDEGIDIEDRTLKPWKNSSSGIRFQRRGPIFTVRPRMAASWAPWRPLT